MASGRHQAKLLKQLFAPTLGISPSPLPFLSPPSSVTVWQQRLSILEGGVAACQSAARVGLSPRPPQPFSLSITSNHAISPATLPFASWQPSVCVSITHPASRASFPALFIKWHYALLHPSFCSLIHASQPHSSSFFFSFLLFPISLHPFVLPFAPPPPSSNAGFPLHINRTLVTAFSASSCLLDYASPRPQSPFFLPQLLSSVSVFLAIYLPFPFCPSCTLPLLSQVSTLPVTLALSPSSPPHSSAICHPSVSSSSDSSKLSLCSHVPTSLSRLHPPFPFLPLHFPECY